MTRLTLDPLDDYLFATEFAVRMSDVNAARHVGHDQLISLMNEARVRFFDHLGIDGLDVDGFQLFIADLAVVYLSEGRQGDRLRVEVGVRDWNRYGCDVAFRVTQAASGREVARAKTGLVCVDPATRRATPLPEGFRERFAAEG